MEIMAYRKRYRFYFNQATQYIASVYGNNPFIFYLLIFFFILMLSNNLIISIKDYPLLQDSEFIIFPEFKTLEAKYRFQNKIFNILKNIKYAKFSIHTVKRGENYWNIATLYSTNNEHIGIDTIIGLNPYLKNIYAVENEKIIVCNKKGALHIIQNNESIASIARFYKKPVELIKKINNRNIIKDIFSPLKKGDPVFIPDVGPKILTKKMQNFYVLRSILSPPVSGKGYTSGFGWRLHPVYKKRKKHKGLDIRARIGQGVYSCADGIVVNCGWASGYGKMIKIQHFNGYTTAYGHLSKIYVRTGQRVKRQQIIGRSGNTGTSTGPHLDFRVWYKGKLKDPALYLW